MKGLPQWNSDIVVPAITMHPGGSALNTAYNVAGLGAGAQCRVVVPIGDDEFGGFLRRQLSAIGLEHCVASLPVMSGAEHGSVGGATGVCICMSGNSDRCFVDSHGANRLLTAAHLWTGAAPAAAKGGFDTSVCCCLFCFAYSPLVLCVVWILGVSSADRVFTHPFLRVFQYFGFAHRFLCYILRRTQCTGSEDLSRSTVRYHTTM